MRKFTGIVSLVVFCLMFTVGYAKDLPKIAILATGGTIAGSGDTAIATTGYKAGVVTIDVLMNAVPQINDIAKISGDQIANIDSSNMTNEIWLKLANKINELLAGDIAGIVITHGTDTMEETAYFLNLVVKSDKPVVLVGAMRPSTAMSADGPKNLYNAVALAASPEAKGRGVMISMGDVILDGRNGVKTNTMQTNTFKSLNTGAIGDMVDGVPFFYAKADRLHTTKSEFSVKGLKELPRVDILYTYTNDGSGVAAEALVKAGAKGIVVAGSGAGNIHENQQNFLRKLIKDKGIIVAKSSRTGSGLVIASDEDINASLIGADNLNPQKARILLMLALTKTSDPKKIQEIFKKY